MGGTVTYSDFMTEYLENRVAPAETTAFVFSDYGKSSLLAAKELKELGFKAFDLGGIKWDMKAFRKTIAELYFCSQEKMLSPSIWAQGTQHL